MSLQYRQKSECRIRVYGFGDKIQGYGVNRKTTNTGTSFDLYSDLRTCNISKDINNPANGFNFTLLPRLNWRDGEVDPDEKYVFKIIKTGDWLRIFFSTHYGDTASEENELVLPPETNKSNLPTEYESFTERMMGIVDRVSKVVITLPSGARQTRYLVSGRCFGKALLETDIYFNPYVEDRANVAGSMLYLRGMVITGSPTDLCNSIMNALMCDMAQYSIPISLTRDLAPDPDAKKRTEIFRTDAYKSLKDTTKKESYTVREPNQFKRKPNKQAFDKFLWRDFQETDGFTINASVLEPRGGLWQVLQQYCNPMMNELYVDLLPWREENKVQKISSGGVLRPTVRLRERPYTFKNSIFGDAPINKSVTASIKKTGLYKTQELATKSIQSALKQREDFVKYFEDIEPVMRINEDEILSEDLGVSEHQRLNWFYITGMMPNNTINQRATFPKAFNDPVSIARYGLRRMEQESIYAMFDDPKKISDLKALLMKWNLTLQHWYENNHLFLNGNITTRALLNVFVGSKLIVKRSKGKSEDSAKGTFLEEHYYVEGVGDEWEYMSPLRTSLQLTRGMVKTSKDAKLQFHFEDTSLGEAYNDLISELRSS